MVWALVPLITLGSGTPIVIAHAAVRRRSPLLFVSAGVYAASFALFLVQVAKYEPISAAPAWLDTATSLGFFLNMFGGFGQALFVRSAVFNTRPVVKSANEQALELATARRKLRRDSRELAEHDPALARELGIGRPDLPREYDDGGLVDINHASTLAIAGIPGLTPDLAARIVAARTSTGLFTSANELSIMLDLPVDLNDELAEYTVYLP
ncbi:ComEA family DNA-binding protein [Acrocarpospora corrugata]|uniref:ComEA family DNA-binding protein n=1 Tax=Acrocarpospora corrugata TaxID=35763 RepID=UPI0012D2E569|nr:helix-hairpin-helix domain-containing protein [Acrocarpospora corrugata]